MTTTIFYGGVEVTSESFEVSIRRGRQRGLGEFEAASGTVKLRNISRNFDPPFFTTPSFLLLENGDFILLESGDQILLEQGSSYAGAYGAMVLGGELEVKDGAVTVFKGHVEDIDYRWDLGGYAEATIVVGDGLNTLARTSIGSEWVTTGNQLPGVRLAALLDRTDVAYPTGATYRSLANGHSRLLGDTVNAGTNALQYAQLVSRSDFGRLYTNRSGVLVYKGRYDWPGESGGTYGNIAATFSDTGANFSFSAIELEFGSELLTFQCSTSRITVGPTEPDFQVIEPTGPNIPEPVEQDVGIARTATATTTPPTRLGARNLSITGLLLRHDAECEARSRYLVDRYSVPEGVVSGLTTILDNYGTTDRATIAALDIDNVLALAWTPTGTGTSVSQSLAVEGVTYQAATNRATTMTWQLSEMPSTNWFKLDTNALDAGVPLGF